VVQQVEEEEAEKVKSEEERETVVREVLLTESEADMEEDEESLKVPRLKKCGEDGENPQAKKVTASRRRARRRGAEPEPSSTDSASPHYSVEEIKAFLRKTKHMWHVKVEDHFRSRQILPLCHLPHVQGRERSLHGSGVLQAQEDPV